MPLPIFDIDSSFSALEIGTFVSMFLLGVATLQVWNYFRDFGHDPPYLKLMSSEFITIRSFSADAGRSVADVLHSIMFMHSVHFYTITGLSNITFLIKTVWSLESSLLLEALIIVTVQCYFGVRVLRVTQSTVLAVGIWILAFVRFGFTISITVLAARHGTLAVAESAAFKWQAVLELSIAAFTDVGTAAALCAGLIVRRTGFASSDRLIDRLVAFTIGSGLLTSCISICLLVAYLTMSGNFVWIAFFSISSKMFSNSLFASLNQRASNRQVLQGNTMTAGASTHVVFTGAGSEDLELAATRKDNHRTLRDTQCSCRCHS